MTRIPTLFLFILFHSSLLAQNVSTFGNAPSNADVAVDAQGRVYVASESSVIYRLSAAGVLETIPFATGLARASGLAFNSTGDTLYVTCRPLNGQGWLARIDTTGNVDTIATGIMFPGDVDVAPNGDIYFNDFNNNIHQIKPGGPVALYANSTQFNTPIGLAWAPGDTLFVSSAHDGNIYKVSPTVPPTVTWFAHVNGLAQLWACGFMVYSNGALYITNGDNKVHRIDMDGTVSDFAGTGGAGEVNGPFDQAQFNAPNGLCVNNDGTKMFLTEYNKTRVRLLELGSTGIIQTDGIGDMKIYPNPSAGLVALEINPGGSSDVTLEIADSAGRNLGTIFQGPLSAQGHQMVVDLREFNLPVRAIIYVILRSEKFSRSMPVLYVPE